MWHLLVQFLNLTTINCAFSTPAHLEVWGKKDINQILEEEQNIVKISITLRLPTPVFHELFYSTSAMTQLFQMFH